MGWDRRRRRALPSRFGVVFIRLPVEMVELAVAWRKLRDADAGACPSDRYAAQ